MVKEMIHKAKAIINKPFFSSYTTLMWLWILVFPLFVRLIKKHSCNNFLIFKGVFFHTIEGKSLYASYPEEYGDINHYGPLFSLVVAPFALTPHPFGNFLWLVALTGMLFIAIKRLPMAKASHIFVYWICANELITALYLSQFNIAIAAIILATFCCVEREKEGWATMFILLGAFVKIYSIVGLAFFFFSKHKLRFVLTFIAWSIVFFVAPMLISSPDFVIGQYGEWFVNLIEKNHKNIWQWEQNVSVLGMIRHITRWPNYSDLVIILPALVLFFLPYLRLKQYAHLAYRYAFLASVLMFVVLYSTGSESSSYIIAFVGVAIWYVSVPWKRSKFDLALLIFAFVLTSLSPTDLCPRVIKVELIRPYALKCLPVFLIWLKMSYEMLTKDYQPIPKQELTNR
ncbi:MAG: glycosyltransferase family 87 protein [Bacteroidaceae bacterium]